MPKQHTPVKPAGCGPDLPLGAHVKLKRPHLWYGCEGQVVTVYNDGRHRVKIAGKYGATFHSDAFVTELELVGAPTDLERELEELRGL